MSTLLPRPSRDRGPKRLKWRSLHGAQNSNDLVLHFGNARYASSAKVAQSVEIARKRNQISLSTAKCTPTRLSKASSPRCFLNRLGGPANVLIFPTSTRATSPQASEQVGGATAVGPMLMGLSKPFNVLPRNTDMENVVNVITITVVQAGYLDFSKAPA
jgi:malate dehydrogenase (oxaloacetate-decarboxylating)(NADP+)